MKQISFWFQYITKIIRRYWYTIIISFIVSGAVFFLIINISPIISQYFPQTRRIGMVGRYRLNNLPPDISHLFSHGLTEILPNSRATSSPIVNNWTIGGEGKEYTFFLKDDVYWQNGDPFKPNQVDYSIKGAQFEYQPGKVTITLESPYAPLPTLLTEPLIKQNKIGLGEYKITNIEVQSGVISKILLTKNNPRKERIWVNFYPTEEDLITAFQLGKIDEAWGISSLDQIEEWKNIEIKATKDVSTSYVGLFLNTEKSPLNNKRFRQALAYCIEKPPEKDRAISPIAPNSWAYNPNIKTYQYDPNHGRSLLEEDWENNEEINLTLTTLPELLNWAEKAKEDWQKNLNVKIQIKVSRFAPNPGSFDIFLGYGIIPTDPDQYSFWHSTRTENLTKINNLKIDQLLEKGRKTVDFQERKEAYYDFQQALSEEVPVIFLYYPKNYTIQRK